MRSRCSDYRCLSTQHDYDIANELAHNALRPHYGISTLVDVNDHRGHSAVLGLFDEVIAAQR
jgi:hypothetical protein